MHVAGLTFIQPLFNLHQAGAMKPKMVLIWSRNQPILEDI
jgi:hypothetical protein